MKRLTLVLYSLLFFISYSVSAQTSKDSLLLVGKDWKSVKITKGVIWKQGHFTDLFGSEQEINFVEVDLKKHSKKVRLGADPKILKTTEAFALENKALVAINGGFFDMKDGGSVDYIKVDGKLVNPTRSASLRANALFSIDKNKVTIASAEDLRPEESLAEHILLSGPLLVLGGERIHLENNAFNSNRHPRTAIAINKNNKLIMLVVDGRHSQAHGMSLIELGQTLKWLGANDAMNLDGGGSSTLYLAEKGVVNYPSDNKKFDHEGQRVVANIVYVTK